LPKAGFAAAVGLSRHSPVPGDLSCGILPATACFPLAASTGGTLLNRALAGARG